MKRRTLLSACITFVCLNLSTAQAILYDDGGTHDFTTDSRYSTLEVFKSSSGDPTRVNLLTGGQVESIMVVDSQVNIAGGAVRNGVSTSGHSYLTISSGIVSENDGIPNIVVGPGSYAVITGGDVGSTALDILGTMEIHGTGFMIDGISVGYGQVTASSGWITGTLQNVDSLETAFYTEGSGSIILVPEPAAMGLLGLGGLLLRVRRWNPGKRGK